MTLKSLVAGILFAGMLVVPALAAENAAAPTDKPARHRKGGGEGGDMAARGQARITQQMDKLTKELTLTQEQQDKVRKLLTDHQTQMGEQMRTRMTPENREKMTDLNKQIEDAKAAGDKAKVKTLEAQRSELTGEAKMTAAREKLIKDVEGLLTDEQKPKFTQQVKDEVFGWPMRSLENNPEALLKAVESLKLPAEKEAKIKGIVDEWKTKGKASKDRDAARAGAPEVYKKVMAELTPEEQAKVKAWHPTGPMGGHEQGAGAGHRGHKRGGQETPAAAEPAK